MPFFRKFSLLIFCSYEDERLFRHMFLLVCHLHERAFLCHVFLFHGSLLVGLSLKITTTVLYEIFNAWKDICATSINQVIIDACSVSVSQCTCDG